MIEWAVHFGGAAAIFLNTMKMGFFLNSGPAKLNLILKIKKIKRER
jgi:hypothetical protein